MARQYEKRYRLSESDDVLEKLRAIFLDLDQRMDAVEIVKEDFQKGNRLDVDMLLKAIDEDLAQKSAAMQEVIEEVNSGFTPDRIEETAEKRFTSDAEQQAIADALVEANARINARATSAALGTHTARTDNPHGVTAAQIGAVPATEWATLVAEMQARGVSLGIIVHSAVPLESQGYLLANGAPCTPVTPDLRTALLAGGSPFGHNGTDPLLPDEVSANRFRRAAGGGLPLGTVQDDQMQGHEHNQHVSATSGTTAGLYTRGVGTDDDRAGSTETSGPISDGLNGTPRVGAETRPKGIAYLPYIKAFGAITIEGMADLSALFNALATEMEAIAGADNTKLMTALRTKQSVAKFAGIVTRLPEVATTSGTAFDFAIDPTATEIMVDLGQVQLSGTDTMIVQLGTSGGFVVTGYDGGTFLQVSGSSAALAPTSGFGVSGNTAARYANGTLILRRIGTSTRWVAHYASGTNGNLAIYAGGGSVDLGAAVTQLRLTRTGSNTFAAGRVGVEYRKNA